MINYKNNVTQISTRNKEYKLTIQRGRNRKPINTLTAHTIEYSE